MFVILLLGGWTGCKQEVDVTAPEAVFTLQSPLPVTDTVCGSLEPGVFRMTSGDTLALDITFRDDEGLAQYKVDIHSNFDCHGHANKTEDWSYLAIEPLSGQEQAVQVRLPVPATVTAGAYHFQIQVLDLAGNTNPDLGFFSILVQNGADTLAPAIDLSSPTGSSLTLARGSALELEGTVSDNADLGSGGNGKLTLFYRDESSGNSFEALSEAFPAGTGGTYPFTLSFVVPQTLIPGAYTFTLRAFDGVNNPSAPHRIAVQVTP